MNQGKMVFAQVMSFASQDIFKIIVARYKGNYRGREFTSWKHFLCLAFGQLTNRESMSDITLAPFEREPLQETFANGRWTEMKNKIDTQLKMF
jgi:hypothetical protein